MLSSNASEETNYTVYTHNNKTTTTSLKRVNSSSISSWSSSSSPSSFSQQPSTTTSIPSSRTMEEVWKDINLASLSETPTTPNPTNTNRFLLHNPHTTHYHRNPTHFRNMTLQDFLARPFANAHHLDPPTNTCQMVSTTTPHHPPHPTPPAPPTVLSLNSGSDHEFQVFYVPDPLSRPTSGVDNRSINDPISSSISNSFTNPFEALASSSGFPSFGNKKRFPESDDTNSSGDRRHKRMIKNRESAARSRARKQAYTNELELEVQHLMEENRKLRRQHEQLCLATASQLPKRHNFHRSSTAPF